MRQTEETSVLPVSSGMEAWSECRSFLKVMFPNWSTADTTFRKPVTQQLIKLVSGRYWSCSSQQHQIKGWWYQFFLPLRCSWSERPPWSQRTGPCPADRGWSCSRWTGSGTCCNPPGITQLECRRKGVMSSRLNWRRRFPGWYLADWHVHCGQAKNCKRTKIHSFKQTKCPAITLVPHLFLHLMAMQNKAVADICFQARPLSLLCSNHRVQVF